MRRNEVPHLEIRVDAAAGQTCAVRCKTCRQTLGRAMSDTDLDLLGQLALAHRCPGGRSHVEAPAQLSDVQLMLLQAVAAGSCSSENAKMAGLTLAALGAELVQIRRMLQVTSTCDAVLVAVSTNVP